MAFLASSGQSGLKARLAGLESLPGPLEPPSGLPGACPGQSFLPGNFTRMPAPARMRVGPHRGAVPAMNASRASEPGLRDSVSGREIREGGLSLLPPALAGVPVDGRRAPAGLGWAGLGLLSLETSGIVRSHR